MNMQTLALAFMAATAIGGVAWVFLYPVLSGENPTYLPFGMLAIVIVLFTVLHPSVRQARRANGNGTATP